jgi:NADPH2:quinone reductase
VGLAAVQIAKALGARVIAAASSESKLEITRQNGADEMVNYSEVDLKQAVKTLTSGRGVDLIYDPVGGRVAEPALRSVAWGGRYLVIGFASGTIPALPVNLTLIKNASIVGVFFGAWSDREPATNQANFDELKRLFDRGLIKPRIDRTIGLDEAPAAIRYILDGHAKGKIVVRIASGEIG